MRGLNEMASNAHAQDMPVADDPNGKSDLGRGPRPVEARETLALPILAEAANVIDVVGPEVEEDALRVTGGQLGGPPRGEGEQQGGRGARSDDHQAYFTRTAA
jgi:hypothetical protein